MNKFINNRFVRFVKPLVPLLRYPYFGYRYPFFAFIKRPVKQTWDFEVTVTNAKTGKPIIGASVESWDKDFSKSKSDNDLLWIDTTDLSGRCIGMCTNNDFQDLAIRHKDKGKPDVYFVVKDRKGQFLHSSKVYTNLDSGGHQYTLPIQPTPKTIRLLQTPRSPFWQIRGELTALANTGPYIVECFDKDYSKKYGPEDLLFKVTLQPGSSFNQRFYKSRFSYKPNETERKPDLYFVVKDLLEQVIYTSPVFSNIKRSGNNDAHHFNLDLLSGQTRLRQINLSPPIGIPAPGSGTGGGLPPANRVPAITLVQPSGDLLQGENIKIDYLALDPESDPVFIEAAFSIDGGTAFQQATEAVHALTQGSSNLRTSPAGTAHTFVWKAIVDLPTMPAQNVVFRLRPFDPKAGATAVSQPFTVGTIVSSADPVVIAIVSPQANTAVAAVVEICYTLATVTPDTLQVKVSFSDDGGATFKPASEAFGFGSEGLQNLSSASGGKHHSFFWNAEADTAGLPANSPLIAQVESFDVTRGGIASVSPLTVDTSNLPPMIDIFSPMMGTRQGSPVAVEYVLTDRDNHIARIEAFYSLDNGDTYFPATLAAGGDGIDNLQATDYGEVKTFLWNATNDLAGTTRSDVQIKIQAFDQHAGGIDISDRFDVTLPRAPGVTIIDPSQGVWGAPLPINYLLAHPGGNQQLTVEIAYSTDGGQNYRPASESPNLGSEGLTDLRATSGGVRHFFAWDAVKDILTLSNTIQRDLRVRVRAYNGVEMGEAESPGFVLDAGYVGVPLNNIQAGTPVQVPSVHVFDPADHTGVHVAARFLVKQPDSLRVNLRVEFSANGGTYQTAKRATDSDQITNLPAPAFNADYKFVWDAQFDLEQLGITSATATLRFTPYIGGTEGTPRETAPFSVTIMETDKPKILPPKTQYGSLSIQIIEGNNQEVIPGLLARENLTVEVTDATGAVVQAARLTFSIGNNSQVPASFEPHPRYRTTTDFYGRSGIRVRPEAGFEGRVQVLVHVVGMPGVTAVFTLTARLPKIVPATSNPTGPFVYGQNYSFYFFFDSEIDLTKGDFLADVYRPVELKVATHNAEADAKIVRLPGPRAYGHGFYVAVTPTYLGGTSVAPSTDFFDLKIEATDLPGVPAWEDRFSVQSDNNAQRLQSVRVLNNGFGPADYVYQDQRLHLEVISGHDPADPNVKKPQTGFPGLTLSTPFQVKVLDDANIEYTHSTPEARLIVATGNCEQITITKENLKIAWQASGGVLSTSAGKGSKSKLDLAVSQKIYFTPTRDGPWSVTASVIDYVFDPSSRKMPYTIKRQTGTTSSGTIVRDPYCASKAGFYVNLRRTFYIQIPEVIGFENIRRATAATPGPLLKHVKAGIKSRLLVQSLSPFTASSVAKEIDLESTKVDGSPVPGYTGSGLRFKQKIDLRPVTQNRAILRSPDILFLQNEEKTSAGTPLAILPLSRIKADLFNIKFSIATTGLKRARLRSGAASPEGDTEFPYESPVGTSPNGGHYDSITLHNGEFVLENCDLSFPSREAEVSCCRSYRSQVQSLLQTDDPTEAVEPLGPGWFLDSGAHLDVSHKHLRFWDGSGAYFDYPFEYAGKGQFIFITRNDVITAAQSAYQIRDRQRNVLHFNIDGTLRFYKDRFGNQFDYQYNEKAQLITIKDCLLPAIRQMTLSYYPLNTTNTENKWVDKLKEIKDFGNRKVTFEYYAKDELRNGIATGGPGFLKKVLFPTNQTVFEGSASAVNHRSYELFEYEKEPRLGWRLKSVFTEDSKGNEQKRLTNHFDSDGRVIRQQAGESEFVITQAAQGVVTYQNKNNNRWTYTFPNSPYWNATAPSAITDPETHTSNFRHNLHGHLVYVQSPKGGTVDYVYDEDSIYARARADLLAVIETSENGMQRTSTYTYSGRHHLLLTSVGPEGNLDGIDPQLHLFFQNYDHQRDPNGEGKGNILESVGPRSLNIIHKPVANNQRQAVWIEDEQQQDYTYNAFGQITSHTDERGVKTEYFYYAAGNPTQGSVGTAGGGFLAQIKYDTRTTAKRNTHLPGNDATPQMTSVSYVYNNYGYRIEQFDQDGIKTIYTLNNLGDIIKEEHGVGVKGLNTTTRNLLGPGGELVKSLVSQAGTGTTRIETTNSFDEYGRLLNQATQINGGNAETTTNKYDEGDRLETTRDGQTGIETTLQYDGRDLVTTSTVNNGSQTYVTERKYTENGLLRELTEATGDKSTFSQNEFGETVKTKNEATGISAETILNDAGIPVVDVSRDANDNIGTASESVVDEYFRVRRVHELRFQSQGGGGTPAASPPKIPENIGLASADYLVALGAALSDGGFGANDGRTTVDLAWDIGDDLVQIKDDGLGQIFQRFDGHGRQLELDDRQGNRINEKFDDASHSHESKFTAKPDDPAFSDPAYTYKLSTQFNEAGVPQSVSDDRNRTLDLITDDAGNITRITDPDNTEVTLAYNDFNILDHSELGLAISGSHTDPAEVTRLQQSIGLFNSSLKVIDQPTFNPLGQLTTVTDNENNVVNLHYGDNQIKKIVYPGAHGEDAFSYDSSGRLKSYTDPGGEVTTYIYSDGRLSAVKTGQSETTFNVDDMGNVNEVIEDNDAARAIQYETDSLGNITRETQNVNGQIQSTEFQYDGTNRLTKAIFGPDNFIEYIYDPKTDRLKEIRNQDGTISSFSYYGDALKQETTNGINAIYGYRNGELKDKRVSGVADSEIQTAYTFDVMDRLTEEVETFEGMQSGRKYIYDTAGRILKEEFTVPFISQSLINRYFYDGDGFIRQEERDEFDPNTGDIIRVVIARSRNELGIVTGAEEISRTVIYSGSGPTNPPGPIVQP